ncbi:hypothetical protein BC938DRAFT_477498 [Jimgerdemannia flammicorona]|uniref:Uncharacterized protein n=1 Tax=Jimgerdemannia flammicorona TaxID=994334 RepID=A0A433QP85_9FUNG|nr:hypothetical protein BC938DRAFT_477498 [Jimgerdemannia flammicorona]
MMGVAQDTCLNKSRNPISRLHFCNEQCPKLPQYTHLFRVARLLPPPPLPLVRHPLPLARHPLPLARHPLPLVRHLSSTNHADVVAAVVGDGGASEEADAEAGVVVGPGVGAGAAMAIEAEGEVIAEVTVVVQTRTSSNKDTDRRVGMRLAAGGSIAMAADSAADSAVEEEDIRTTEEAVDSAIMESVELTTSPMETRTIADLDIITRNLSLKILGRRWRSSGNKVCESEQGEWAKVNICPALITHNFAL